MGIGNFIWFKKHKEKAEAMTLSTLKSHYGSISLAPDGFEKAA